MRQKISKGGIVRRLSIALISALCLVTISPSPASALNLLEKYFTLDYEIELSKTSIRGSETFYATVEGTATCKRNFPVRATKGYVTYRIVAEHQTSGSVVTLNERYTINIDPFPNRRGDSIRATETVSLRFPSGSQSGSYDIKGRPITARVNTTSLLRWLPVTRYLPSTEAMDTVTYTAGDDGFEVSDLTITPSEVSVGKTVAIIVRITNTGDLAGTYEVTLTINDATVETKQVKVAGGASETATFTVAEDEAGTYSVDVDGLTGSFTVREVAVPPPVVPPPAPPTAMPRPITYVIIGVAVFLAIFLPIRLRRRRLG